MIYFIPINIIDKIKENGIAVSKLSRVTGIPLPRIYKWLKKSFPKLEDQRILDKFLKGEEINFQNSTPGSKEIITALQAAVKVLTLEVIQLRHQITKESMTAISLEIEKMVQSETKNLQS